MTAEFWDLLAWMVPLAAALDVVVVAGFMVWVLMTKSDSTSAVAWLLLLVFLPFLGSILFLLFGYQHVHRRLRRKRLHSQTYQDPPDPVGYAEWKQQTFPGEAADRGLRTLGESLSSLASRLDASDVTQGNQLDFYRDGIPAFDAIFEAIRQAKHHIHLQTFIFRNDHLGKRMIAELAARARQGIEVRLLYDGIGSHNVGRWLLKPLHEAGGQSSPFLPLSPLRRRFQINMRNHRKILVVDGAIGFIGGLNVGDEYLGLHPGFGYWRDTHMRVRGPAVADLQRVFAEDWDFAADEYLSDEAAYFKVIPAGGPHAVQVVDSGPDQDIKAIREVTFAALLKARRRIWIASPYFVPDVALLDALRLAAFSGVDVRFLGQLKPDKYVPQFAAKYYWASVLDAGVKVHQYARGMMHAKVLIIDDEFASVGSANFDNRSMFLNFEVNCLLYSPEAVQILAATFEQDFAESLQIDPERYSQRGFGSRLMENACRLLSPVL